MPKKPPPNGYYYFMQDFRKREERRGRRFINGMRDVAVAASDEWKHLPQTEKDRYTRMAKELRNCVDRISYEKSDERRFNSEGKSFAEIKREEQQEANRIDAENKYISNFVDTMDMDALRNKFIYLIHVNIFCKTANDIYYPAELGIIRFNLSKGTDRVLQRYIDPGAFATGYSFDAKDHSDRTHKLTREFIGTVSNTNDHCKTFKDILELLQEREVKGTIPPLFTMYDDVFQNTSITAVRKTLKMLYESYDNYMGEDYWESRFKVYPLPELFTRLKNKCCALINSDMEAFPNSALATFELQKDSYNFDMKLACKFHRDEDRISMCSKSYVIRWSYIIRDHCCEPLGIDFLGPKEEFEDDIEIKQEIKSEHDIKSEKYYDYDDDKYSTSSGYSYVTAKTSLTMARENNVNVGYSGAVMKEDKYKYNNDDVKMKDQKYDKYDDVKVKVKEEKIDDGKVKVKEEKIDDVKVKVKEEKIDDGYPTISNWSTSNTPPLAKMMQEMDTDSQSMISCPSVAKPPAWCVLPKREAVPALNNDHFPVLGIGRGSARRGNK